MARRKPTRDAPWSGGTSDGLPARLAPLGENAVDDLLEFANLSHGAFVLVVGEDAVALSVELARRGHRVVAVGPSSGGTVGVGEGGARFVAGDAGSIPLRTGAFDAGLCIGVLGRIPDGEAVIAELARVIRPGGSLLLQDPVAPAEAAGRRELERLEKAWDPEHRRLLSVYEVCAHFAGEYLGVEAHRLEEVEIDVSGLPMPGIAPGADRSWCRRDSDGKIFVSRRIATWLLRIPDSAPTPGGDGERGSAAL